VRLGRGQDQGHYLSAYYRQVMRRQGKPKAVMALTHKILVIAWHLLSNGALYDDPGPAAVSKVSQEQQRRRAIRQLEALGLTVTVQPREGPGAA
jgi:transposase